MNLTEEIKEMFEESVDFQRIAPWFRELMARKIAARLRLHLTALRLGVAVSIFVNVILLAVVAFTIGGR